MDTAYPVDGSSPCLRAPVRAWLFLSSRPAARILPRAPTAESLARRVLFGAKRLNQKCMRSALLFSLDFGLPLSLRSQEG